MSQSSTRYVDHDLGFIVVGCFFSVELMIYEMCIYTCPSEMIYTFVNRYMLYEPVITKYVSTIRSPTLKGAT